MNAREQSNLNGRESHSDGDGGGRMAWRGGGGEGAGDIIGDSGGNGIKQASVGSRTDLTR